MREYIFEKTSNMTHHFKFGGIDVHIDEPLPDDISIERVLKTVEQKLPSVYYQDLRAVRVGSYKEFDRRQVNALYKDQTLFISNEQDNMKDLLDDIIHEIAHHLETKAAEEIYIAWNSSGIDGDVTMQWAKTSPKIDWNNIDEVGVGENSYYWWLPNELENYNGKIIIKIYSSSRTWIKDEVTIGPFNDSGKKTTVKPKRTTATTELVVYVDNFYPSVGSYLNISWNQNTPVNIWTTYSPKTFFR